MVKPAYTVGLVSAFPETNRYSESTTSVTMKPHALRLRPHRRSVWTSATPADVMNRSHEKTMATHDTPESDTTQGKAAEDALQRELRPIDDGVRLEPRSGLRRRRTTVSWLIVSASLVWLAVLLLTIQPIRSPDSSDEIEIDSTEPISPSLRRSDAISGAIGGDTTSVSDTHPNQPNLIETAKREPAPRFELPDIDSGTATLSDYDGQVLLLNFWATWCLPCRAEMPWFVDFQTNFGDEGFRVLGVSLDDPGWSAIHPFLKHQPVNYQIALADTTERLMQFGLINILPTTWLIDRNGRIAAKHVGLVRREQIEREIDQLLNE